MAYEIVFTSTEKSQIDSQMVVRATANNELLIEIFDSKREFVPKFVFLDRETAIKLAKELRKQISFLED